MSSAIKFKQVRKKFGEREVLKGIDIEIRKGEIVFILGTSGTGKSVLLKNLVGLMKPDSGSIFIFDQEVSKLSEEEYLPIRKICGMVFQHPALFDSVTVFENVAFGLRKMKVFSEAEIESKVQACLSLVGMDGSQSSLPSSLSYGMQKRVSMARTLALEPKILLFDEPTTGLDPVTTQAINDLIQDLSRKLQTTSVVVSHDMSCALKIADRIVMLDQGQVVDQGTPEHMMNSQFPLVQEFLAETKMQLEGAL